MDVALSSILVLDPSLSMKDMALLRIFEESVKLKSNGLNISIVSNGHFDGFEEIKY